MSDAAMQVTRVRVRVGAAFLVMMAVFLALAALVASHAGHGLDGHVVGIDRFGLSAPGGTAMKELGMTVDAVVTAARSL